MKSRFTVKMQLSFPQSIKYYEGNKPLETHPTPTYIDTHIKQNPHDRLHIYMIYLLSVIFLDQRSIFLQ